MYEYNNAIDILVTRFPEMKTAFSINEDEYIGLPYYFFESEFVKFIIDSANNKDEKRLYEIFEFIEDMLSKGNEEMVNLLEVAVVESLLSQQTVAMRSL